MKWPFLVVILLVVGFVIIQVIFIKKLKAKKGKLIENDGSEFSRLILEKKRLMVYFWTETCSVCRRQTPILEKLKREFQNVVFYNLTNNPLLAKKIGVMAVPTIMVIENSKIIDVLIGLQKEEKLRDMLKKLND